MSFSFNTATNIGKVRVLINDKVETGAQLSDEDINVFLSLEANDIYSSAANCLKSIAASKALLAIRKKAGNYDEDLKDIAKNCLAVAKTYEDKALATPADAQPEEIITDFNLRQVTQAKALRNDTD